MRIAILGGAHQSGVMEENNLPGWDTLKNNYSKRTGPHFGFLADLPFSSTSKFSFQPSVIFYPKGRKYLEKFDTTVSNIIQISKNEFISTIDVPLNFVYRIKLGGKSAIFLGGGPYVSFFYKGRLRSETISKDTIDFEPKFLYNIQENNDPPVGDGPGQYNTLDFGVNALAGIEFGRIFLRADYSRGMKDFFTPLAYTASDYKHEVMGITLGIYLGKPVPVEKKVKDKDKDGIPDDRDSCVQQAGPAITNGCPDKDGDGTADKNDKCPDEAGPADNGGCPILDRDKDGVNDNVDACPDVAGLEKYKGCPVPDTDKDGINDENDKCPTVPGFGRYDGCPIPDSDGDGVNDEEDRCPAVAGIADKGGCPEEINKEIVEKVNLAARRIQFKVNKAELLPESYKVLDEVVKVLNENPELKLSIEGHTSSEGPLAVNMKLSESRAGTVRRYLESKGIDTSRLEAKGFGPSQLLNNDRTPAEKSQNRRVELTLSN
jgi:OmpA-OmpF porin, OOP family